FLLHIIFSSHLYTKTINDIVVIVSTFFIIKSY
ncbi:transposase, partial [Shigella dysenteriae]